MASSSGEVAAGGAGLRQQRSQQQQEQQQQLQEAQQPQQPASQQQQQFTQGQPQYLYEPRYGLPVVRRRLNYSELLRDIRLEKVSEVRFFSQHDSMYLEGPCLVVYTDGSVAQGYIPQDDYRMHYAMETNGVRGVRLEPTPTQSQLTPPRELPQGTRDFLVNVLPYLAVALVYLATQIVRWRKMEVAVPIATLQRCAMLHSDGSEDGNQAAAGTLPDAADCGVSLLAATALGDAEDRDKLRRKAEEDKRRKRAEEEADQIWDDIPIMAREGLSVDIIFNKYKGRGVLREEVEAIVRRVAAEEAQVLRGDIYNTDAALQLVDLKELKAKIEAEQAESDEMAQAEQMLKLKTVKIQKARDPARERVMKEASRKLKNVKLQYTDPQEAIFFEDVAGIGDAKVELQEVVDFFRKPERFRESGSRIPRGVLLCGPPGTGKTLLARAVAGEAGVAFLSLNASEFVEMFVGVGASRVRDLFSTARSMAPAIIFIDEIDSVGRIRGGARGNDERDQTLNQMLSEMDGFDNESQVIVMAATNRRDILDPALVRPGRFDRIIYVPLPDYNGRIEILKVHLGKRAYSPDIDLHELAFETARSSGAQLANLVNVAATIASQDGREEVHNADLLKALEQERLGPQRAPFSKAARRRVAIMEAATAIACTLLPAIEPVVQVTIVPREKYPLGQTVVKANEQRELTQLFTRRYLEEQLLTTLADRAAEELAYGLCRAAEELVYGLDEMSTMNQRRLVTARRIVSKLVVSNAMTDNAAIGPRTVSIPSASGSRALKQIVTKFVPYDVQVAADEEMERRLARGYEDAKALVARNRDLLDRRRSADVAGWLPLSGMQEGYSWAKGLVEALLARDTVSGEDVREMVRQYGNPEDVAKRDAAAAPFM
ncbi:hypothetical protein N2152v2_003256 [Parachlorella kessleri]